MIAEKIMDALDSLAAAGVSPVAILLDDEDFSTLSNEIGQMAKYESQVDTGKGVIVINHPLGAVRITKALRLVD